MVEKRREEGNVLGVHRVVSVEGRSVSDAPSCTLEVGQETSNFLLFQTRIEEEIKRNYTSDLVTLSE